MMDGCTDGYGTCGLQSGLSLNGGYEGIFDVLAAPFKLAAKGGKALVGTVSSTLFPGSDAYPQSGAPSGLNLAALPSQVRDWGLRTAAQEIADTPQGRAAIREKVASDVKAKFLLPAALISIPLVFFLARKK